MKIMHVAGGGDRGGAKTHILALCSRLKERHALKLVSLRSGEFAEDAIKTGIDTTVIYSKVILADYVRLIRMVRREKPDIIHCHGAKANTAGALVKLFRPRTTIITTVHSDYKLDYMHSFVKRQIFGRLNTIALRFFDYYVTVSDSFKQMLIERGFSPLKLMTIYNGLDFSKRAPAFDRGAYLREQGLDYEEGDVVLGIAVRLTPVKDCPTLLRALAKAREQNSRLKLLIGGEGEELDNLKTLCRELGIEKAVCFCGWVTDINRFFAACDIDVICSISESFPYSILEGVREECAVITSDVGGMRALIDSGQDGYIFAPKDVDAFAGYITDLAGDAAKRARFASLLRDKAEKLYSLDGMAGRQSEIYEKVLALETRKRQNKRDGVLICGAYGRGNSGDEAILKAIIASMTKIDPLMPLTVMSRNPLETAALHEVRAIYIFNVPKFLRAALRSRLFINGGGSLIQDTTSSRSLYFYLFTIWAANKLGANVLMYGCGIGHVGRRRNQRLAARILNHNADIITLRDQVSQTELDAMCIARPDIRPAADPAMSLSPAPGDQADRYLHQQGMDPAGKYICFSLRNWKDFTDFSLFTRAASYAYRTYGLTALFLPIEVPKDIAPSLLACEGLDTPHHVLDTPRSVELTIALLQKMQCVCAMRLHALVFSAAAGVPFAATSYDIKVDGFMDYVDRGSLCCGLSQMTEQWLCQAIDRLMTDGGKFDAKRISDKLRRLEAENTKAARELLDLSSEEA